MSTLDPRLAAALAAQNGSGLVRVPTQAEKDEVKRINGLQVRTNAALAACNAAQGGNWEPGAIVHLASRLESFIWGEV